MSAEARSELPEPMARDDGGRSDEAPPASGVLLRFPMMWLPDILSITQSTQRRNITNKKSSSLGGSAEGAFRRGECWR